MIGAYSTSRKKLTVHPGKSEAMIMMKTPFTGPLRPLKYGENYVKFVSVTTCLGIEIDHKLSWNAQIGEVSKNYFKKIGALKRMKLPKRHRKKFIIRQFYHE